MFTGCTKTQGMSSIAIVIPARLQSTRLPEKPLVDLLGTSLIMRVYRQAIKVPHIRQVIVATDDAKIFEHVINHGGQAMMTDTSHTSGTDRIGEVALSLDVDYIINVQGDEPLIDPRQISDFIEFMQDIGADIATQCIRIHREEDLFDYNVVKVVKDINSKALYFSRQAIPAIRDVGYDQWLKKSNYFKHIGIYGFKREVLLALVKLPMSALEVSESLEQLRWLENGYSIHCQETTYSSIGVDTPDDIEKVVKHLQKTTVKP